MKSKKLISLLCAAAMSASAFAGLTVTASAATTDDILWSDTFNNQATGVIADGTKSQITKDDYVNGLTFVTTNRSGGDRGGYTANDNTYIYNGSYYSIKDDKTDTTDKYLHLSFPVFGDYEMNGRWAHVDLGEGYEATDAEDVVMDFDLKLNDGLTEGEKSTQNPVLRIGSFADNTATAVKIDKSANNLGDDWVHARIIVSKANGAKLYIGGQEVTSAANANVKALNSIGLYSADGKSNCGDAMADIVGNTAYDKDGTKGDPEKLTQTPTVDLDNVIIYNETAGVATGTSEAPGAQNQEGGATPEPDQEEELIPASPVLVAPSGVTGLQSYTFDNIANKKLTLGTEATDDTTTVPGLKIHIGNRDKGGTVDTYAAVTPIAQGKALQLASNKYGTAGRAPRINFTTGLPVSLADNKSTAVTFNVYLSAAEGHEEDATPRLFFMKDDTQEGKDSAGAYRNIAAVLTTVEGETIYRGGDTSSDQISAYVTPNEWHKVTMVITPGSDKNTHRVYIDDDYDKASISVNYVATGGNAKPMEDLPYLTVESRAGQENDVDTTPSYGVATIDNILAYQGVVDNPKKLLPTSEAAPTPAPVPAKVKMDVNPTANTVTLTSDKDTDAVLVQASYRTDNTLDSVKKVVNVALTAGKAQTLDSTKLAAFTKGDKIMVWDSLKTMTPLADAYTVTTGADQATPEPVASPSTSPTKAPIPTVTTATLHDASNKIVDADLYKAGSYSVTPTAEEGYTKLAIAVEDLQKHQNGAGTNGYWVGVKITAPENLKITDYYFAKDEYTAESTLTAEETPVQDESFYVNVGDANEKTSLAVKLSDGSICVYKFDTTGVKKYVAINAVTLVKNGGEATVTGPDSLDLTKVAEGTELTITANTPDEGYLANPTITVTKTGDADTTVTVTEGKFTMPAYPVTVTVTYKAEPTYTVSGTVDAGVKSVTLTEKTDAETPNKYEGTVKTDDKTVTFEKVKAGTYTVSATANSGKEIDTIKLGETEVTEVTVTDADVTTLTVTSKDEAVIPYAEGTITYDGDGDTKVFTELGRVTGTLETTALADNSTKYEKLVANGGKPRAQYVPYAGNYPLKGDAIVANFDYAITGRPEAISLVGKSYSGGEADDNNADTGKLFTISVTTDAGEIEIPKTGNTIDGTNNNSNAIKTGVTGTMNKWYHVETVTNMTDKKIAVKIYAYKANNNYSKETPVYSETLDFRDSTVTGLAGIMINSNSNYGGAAIDNIYFYDQTYITPIKVTATDATVDTTQVLKDDVIKITPKVPSGKKISAVKVNGDPIDAATDGTYKYTVLGTETAIAVTVDFVRADVDNVVVSSTNVNVQKGSSGTYTATVYADAAKKVDITKDSTITWSIAPATEGGVDSLADGTSITNGKLEVADEQSTGKIIITATAVKDITKTDDTTAANQVAGTFEVNIISEPSYQIGVATPANGTVTITVGDNTAAASVKQSENFEIIPKANAGYEIDTVSYRLTTADDVADSYTTVTVDDNGKYTVAGAALSGDITVKVTFKAINYNITNNTVAENGNSIAIRIGDTEAATAIVGQTITIVPTIANGYKLKSISVKNGNTDVTVTNNTFTMPAADVTVEATFEVWDGIYYSQDFESYADTEAVKADWVSASYPAGVTLVTGDTTYGQYLSMDDGTQNGRGVRLTLPTSAEITGQYKMSFDANITKGSTANRTESSISIGGKDAKTANTNSTFGSGYLFEMVVANDTGIATVSGMTENNTFTPANTTWYHYDLTVDTEAKTVAVVITAKDEAATQLFSGTATINGNGVLKYIQLVGGRAKGKVLMDNIKVTAPWYTDASSGTGTENGTETTPDEGTEA